MAGGKTKTCRRRLTAATGVAAAVVLAAAGCTSTPHSAPLSTATSAPASAVTPTLAPLTSSASVTRQHPIIGRMVGVVVATLPDARITITAHFPAGDRTKTARANRTGLHTFWFQTAGATPGHRVRVDVHVYAHGQERSSRAWFTPRHKPPPPPPPPPVPAASSPAAAPAGCYPTTSTGHCYEPGEFCPHADAGMKGVAGNGEAIICEDNNGLRWEPA